MRGRRKIQIETIPSIRLSDFMKHKPLKQYLDKEQQEGIMYTSYELKFHVKNKEYNQKIRFKSKPSNLIDGAVIWMFYCNNYTSFKLYLHNGMFVNVKQITDATYGSQTLSTSMREKYAPLWDWNSNKFTKQLNKKYFKKTYRGALTKRYLYLIRKDATAKKKERKALGIVYGIVLSLANK